MHINIIIALTPMFLRVIRWAIYARSLIVNNAILAHHQSTTIRDMIIDSIIIIWYRTFNRNINLYLYKKFWNLAGKHFQQVFDPLFRQPRRSGIFAYRNVNNSRNSYLLAKLKVTFRGFNDKSNENEIDNDVSLED